MPVRIQRKRSKGWTLPRNAVIVSRPTKWGNPFVADNSDGGVSRDVAVLSFRMQLKRAGTWSAIPPEKWPRKDGMLTHVPREWTTVEDVKRELRGKDLCCWCPLDRPCHADVLLSIANDIPYEDVTPRKGAA